MKKATNKSTNKYRKCPNCPHHSLVEQKCCCQKNSTSRQARAMTSRNKREPSTIDHSLTVNTTLPTIIAEFSALRTQNNHLKRQLLNVSTFLKDDFPQTHTPNDTSLSQRLFLSNKNLKEALLDIDSLSKANKELCERNSRLSEQSEGRKIQLREVEDYLERYKRKCKKMVKDNQILASRQETEQILQQNQDLEEEVRALREELRCLRFENRNYNMVGVLSPEWVASTGNKGRHVDVPKCEEEVPRQEMEIWKRSLSQTISLLKNEASYFSGPLESSNQVSFDVLIERLLESYSASVLAHFQLLIKEMNRKLNNYEKKFNNMGSKLQNFALVFHNKKLRRKLQPGVSLLRTERSPMSELTNRVV